MKLLLISIITFLFLSLFYLTYFFSLNIKEIEQNESKVIRFIKYKLFTTVSCATILFFVIYIGKLTNGDYFLTLIIVLLLIFLGLLMFFSESRGPQIIGLLWTIVWMIIFIYSLGSPSIKSENYTSTIIPLYDTNIIRDDLSAVIINITPEEVNQKNYHTFMQYSTNDINNFEIPTMLNCKTFKLIDSKKNKLEITIKEITKSNILYYHGFTNFTPETTFDKNAIEYILYINPDNIIYE